MCMVACRSNLTYHSPRPDIFFKSNDIPWLKCKSSSKTSSDLPWLVFLKVPQCIIAQTPPPVYARVPPAPNGLNMPSGAGVPALQTTFPGDWYSPHTSLIFNRMRFMESMGLNPRVTVQRITGGTNLVPLAGDGTHGTQYLSFVSNLAFLHFTKPRFTTMVLRTGLS